jgi:cytochrome bd-type quinol oxidase subunit 2
METSGIKREYVRRYFWNSGLLLLTSSAAALSPVWLRYAFSRISREIGKPISFALSDFVISGVFLTFCCGTVVRAWVSGMIEVPLDTQRVRNQIFFLVVPLLLVLSSLLPFTYLLLVLLHDGPGRGTVDCRYMNYFQGFLMLVCACYAFFTYVLTKLGARERETS